MYRLFLVVAGLFLAVAQGAYATTVTQDPIGVPEPATLALFSAAAGALVIARYRGRK